jgi:hypothetical protein
VAGSGSTGFDPVSILTTKSASLAPAPGPHKAAWC